MKKNNYLALVIFFFFSACLKKERPVELMPFTYQSTASCALNINSLKNIFGEDVTKDIDCWEESFENYTRLVRKKDDRYIGYAELKRFMQSHYKEARAIPDGIFESVFTVISFFGGQSNDQLEVQKVKNAFQLIRFLNQNIPSLLQKVQRGRETHLMDRDELKNHLELFVKQFKEIIDFRGAKGGDVRINMNTLLYKLGKVKNLSPESVRLFGTLGGIVKRMLVGGSTDEISFKECLALIEKLPEAILFLKDFNYFGKEGASLPQEQYNRLYYTFFTMLPSLLYDGFKRDEIIVPSSSLYLISQHFYPNYNLNFEELEELEEHIVFLKKKLFNNVQKDWSYGDILKLSRWGQVNFGSLYFNELTYRHFYAQSDFKITLGRTPPLLKEYDVFPAQDLILYWENFKSIVTSYRYFKNNYTGQTFQNQISDDSGGYRGVLDTFTSIELDRHEGEDKKNQLDIIMLDILLTKNTLNPDIDNLEEPVIKILNEISLVKIIVSTLVDMYSDSGVVGKGEMKTFLEEFSPLLKFFSIDMGVTDAAISNLFNVIDLLQFQSNGNEVADIEEMTEFVTSLFFARRLSAEFYIDLGQHCPLEYDEGTGQHSFETGCYRERFVSKFFQGRGHRIYFNGLRSDPVLMNDPKKQWRYFLYLEALSRKDRTGEIIMGKDGLMRMMLAFFNIEGVCDRLDRDANGLINTEEVNSVYPVFRNFIAKKMGSPPLVLRWDKERLVKSVFVYILKNHKRPNSYQLLWYHLVEKNFTFWSDADEIEAEREDVVKVVNAVLK